MYLTEEEGETLKHILSFPSNENQFLVISIRQLLVHMNQLETTKEFVVNFTPNQVSTIKGIIDYNYLTKYYTLYNKIKEASKC